MLTDEAIIKVIVSSANIAVTIGKMEPLEALLYAAQISKNEGLDALARVDTEQTNFTDEEIDDFDLLWVTADDILAGNAYAPGIGNVRDYALNLMG